MGSCEARVRNLLRVRSTLLGLPWLGRRLVELWGVSVVVLLVWSGCMRSVHCPHSEHGRMSLTVDMAGCTERWEIPSHTRLAMTHARHPTSSRLEFVWLGWGI
ncbi:hypothetical protein BDW42DRAFT_174675 [Aspergillus taichungensis]|uniref:Uncharacterized protein n=1 Tax=Aspergillus taichungensis TaxID=482145 RepID=A0A2J5HN39_9EURO|nr:hypothetical protein BDW42DRAFT_174675 [Aspergillus taichungensis]